MYMCALTHPYVCHDSFKCVFDSFIRVQWLVHVCAMTRSCEVEFLPWLIHMCAMTHSYVCHDSFMYVPWLIHMCAMTCSCEVEFARQQCCHSCFEVFLFQLCDMTHSCVRHARACVTWLEYIGNITHLHVRHDSFICVTWLIHMCNIHHLYAFVCVKWTYLWHDPSTWLLHLCDMTHSCVRHAFVCVTWLI